MDNQQIAADLFSAFQTGDMDTVRQLCAPEFRARQNLNNEFDVETLIQFSQAVSAIVKDFRYEDIIRSATDSGSQQAASPSDTVSPTGSHWNSPTTMRSRKAPWLCGMRMALP